MLFAAVGCLCAAAATAALGGWTLSRPRSADTSDRFCAQSHRPSWPPRRCCGGRRGGTVIPARDRRGGRDRMRRRRGRHSCGWLLAEREVRRGEDGSGADLRSSVGRLWRRRLRDLHPVSGAAKLIGVAAQLVPADVDRVGGQQRQRQRLAAQHRPHRSTLGSTSTSDGNADSTIQSSRSISPSSWPIVQPE